MPRGFLNSLNKNKLLLGLEITALIIFVTLLLGMVFTWGVCCADDAYHAVIAKNLADGLNYSSTIPSHIKFSVTPFDPGIGDAPTIILPAALIIKIFGNTYWAPGLSNVILNTILLILIGLCLQKLIMWKNGLTIGIIFFFLLNLFFLNKYFGLWYILIGEVPASLLILLAILIYFVKYSKANLVMIGVLFSLASLTKLLTLLAFFAFLLFLIFENFNQQKPFFNLKSAVSKIKYILLGFFIPHFLFELWKLITLGFSGYKENWLTYIYSNILVMGLKSSSTTGNLLIERLEIFKDNFNISLLLLLGIIIGIGLILYKDNIIFSLYKILVLIFSVYTIYWFLFSIGWPRYFFIAIMLAQAIFCLPFLSEQVHRNIICIYIGIFLIIFAINIINKNIANELQAVKSIPSVETKALLEVKEVLSSRNQNIPLITEYWASFADIEYILDTHLNGTNYWDPNFDPTKPYNIIINTIFNDKENKAFLELFKNCIITEIYPYRYGSCNQ